MQQDFSHKISIVVNKGLPTWQAMNAIAHISANFGHFLEGQFSTGDSFDTQDAVHIPRNSQYAIIVFESDRATLQEFAQEVYTTENIKPMYFIREMIETSDDIEIAKSVNSKNFNNIDFLGVGIFGENAQLKSLTKKFKLWS